MIDQVVALLGIPGAVLMQFADKFSRVRVKLYLPRCEGTSVLIELIYLQISCTSLLSETLSSIPT